MRLNLVFSYQGIIAISVHDDPFPSNIQQEGCCTRKVKVDNNIVVQYVIVLVIKITFQFTQLCIAQGSYFLNWCKL
jgi:hypothetical protein